MEKGEVIGSGREAEVIYWGNNRVLKLYYKDFSSSTLDYRFYLDMLIRKIYPNCPKAFEKIEENGRIGIIYEYIEGVILREFMEKNKKKIGKVFRMLADMHVDMHRHGIKGINSQKNLLILAIHQTDLLDDNQKNEIFKYLEKLPDGNTICHGDFHPENIIVSKDKLYAIDWANSYSGNPNGDVARTFYLLKYGLGPSDEEYIKKGVIHKFFFKVFKVFKSRLAKIYINHYQKLTGISLKEIKKWDLPIFAARLREGIPLENDNLLEMINKLLKHQK